MSDFTVTDHEMLGFEFNTVSAQTAEAFLASFDISRIPVLPGCYIMQEAHGKPLYVGKAKNLRNRIRTYITERDTRPTVQFFMRRVARIEFLVTSTEKEALLLENSLIKQYKPKYNIQLKDDKTYISLRLDVREDFPRLTVVRRYKKDQARYFGPYTSAHSARESLRQIQRMFPLRRCSDSVMRSRVRPCLYHQMNQCGAPCVKLITRDDYHAIVDQVLMVLEGRNAEVERTLLEEIQRKADALAFEQAAVLRDRLLALRKTLERQRTVVASGEEDRDIFGVYRHGRFCEIQILFYRGGSMLGDAIFRIANRMSPHWRMSPKCLCPSCCNIMLKPR